MKKGLQRKKSYRTQLKKQKEKPDKKTEAIFVKSLNPEGKDCRRISPADLCFCGHRASMHLHTNPPNLQCSEKDCSCSSFHYVPSKTLKCICKHSSIRHDPLSFRCKQCISCLGFASNWTCSCGYRLLDHTGKALDKNGKPIKQEVKLPPIKDNSMNYPKFDRVKESNVVHNPVEDDLSFNSDEKQNVHQQYRK